MIHNLIQCKQTQKKELVFVSAVRQVVWTRESEVENEVRGLLNPLLVRPSASRPYPCPVRSYPPVRFPLDRPSACPLDRPSTCPPVRLYSMCRPPVRSPSAPVRSSTLVCPSALCPPRLRFPKITYHFFLLERFLPLVRHVRSPRLQFLAPAGATVALG